MKWLSTLCIPLRRFMALWCALVATGILDCASAAEKSWLLSDERINYLMAGEVCESIGLKETLDGRKRLGVHNWKMQAARPLTRTEPPLHRNF